MIDRSIKRRAFLAAAVAAALVLGTGAAATADDGRGGHDRDDRGVTVQTYNVDFGTDLAPLFTAPAAQLPAMAFTVYHEMTTIDYAGRADAIARLVERARPDVAGFQEVALWETKAYTAADTAYATTYDFESLLVKALRRHGLDYRVAVENVTFRSALPMIDASDPKATPSWVRFTDKNLILVRHGRDVSVTNPQQGTYKALIPLPAPLGINVTRGWASADVTVAGTPFRFFTTHLEAYTVPLPFPDPDKTYFRTLQAKELVALVAASPLPVIVTGDVNSRPTCTGVNTAAYGILVAAGLTEVWPAAHPDDPCGGFTSGSRQLNQAPSALTHRIDDVFFQASAFRAVRADVVGDRTGDRTRSGLWPSDHASTVATLVARCDDGHGHH